ncbi:MAG: sugar ABC transporter permease [Blautia sp.]|nr:sugar ABC transporter permease [Blautia sp.]
MKIATKKKLEGYLFVLPGFLYILLILGYPLIYNIVLALRNVNVKTFAAHTDVFVGIQNFKVLFADPTFRKIFGNTLVFTFGCLFFQFTIGFIFALFFSQKFTLSGPIRGLVLVAYMMPMSVTALLGKNMFDVSSGVFNDLLMKLHLIQSPVEWLLKGNTAMAAVIFMNCWVGIPFNMLLLTSGLTGISQDIYESAEVDGANKIQKFLHITLPLVRPAIVAVLMLGFIYTFKAFDLQFVMTSGGPLNATDVLGTYSYQLSFTQYEFSKGSASAIVLFCCLFIVGLFYLRMIAKEDD